MENTSKALLIAAAVLIVIIIIAVSMKIFNVNEGITDDAGEVGESIKTETTKAADEAIDIFEKNLVRIKDHRVTLVGREDEKVMYANYNFNTDLKSKILLEPNTRYKLSFDYKIVEHINDSAYNIHVRNWIR